MARASTRQAAQKAKEAITTSAEGNSTGPKRKAASEKAQQQNKKKRAGRKKSIDTISHDADDGVDAKVKGEPTKPPSIDAYNEETSAVKPEDISSQKESIPGDNGLQEQQSNLPQSTELGVRKSEEREDVVPSNILEKGIIYFFFRPRVNVDDPNGMSEIARSFFVLRPTPLGAEFNGEQGSLDKDASCRLIMLPKKKFPVSHVEKDMAFVEKAGKSMKDLQETFIASTTYQTKTLGERTTHEARPYAEGVYAITSTKRTSHLAYIITLPKELGEVQTSFGLHERGSWIVQSKNPKFPGPPIGQLPKEAEYPES